MHFEKESAVFHTMQKIARRLTDLQLPYALAGGMAMFLHGYRRFTEDVDLLVTRDTLRTIHEKLEGLGYVPPFEGSKHLRDAETGVRIEFIVTGDFPGDRLPKPISFPDPLVVAVEIEGVRCLGIPALVQLKLASGTAPGRRKDLGDVQELIRLLALPEAFAEQLDGSVRELYHTLWQELQQLPPQD